MMANSPRVGGRNRLLAALRPHNLELLQPYFQHVVLTRDQVLNRPGERADFVYFPTRGLICLVGETSDGNTIQSAAIGSEGALNVLGGVTPKHAGWKAEVLMAGAAIKIPVDRLEAAARSTSQIRDLIVGANALLMAQMQQTSVCNALHGTQARLARWLLDAAWRLESDAIAITQDSLANLLGVHRGSLNSTFQLLQRQGLIAILKRGTTAINGRERLAVHSCECHGRIRDCTEELLQRLAG